MTPGRLGSTPPPAPRPTSHRAAGRQTVPFRYTHLNDAALHFSFPILCFYLPALSPPPISSWPGTNARAHLFPNVSSCFACELSTVAGCILARRDVSHSIGAIIKYHHLSDGELAVLSWSLKRNATALALFSRRTSIFDERMYFIADHEVEIIFSYYSLRFSRVAPRAGTSGTRITKLEIDISQFPAFFEPSLT